MGQSKLQETIKVGNIIPGGQAIGTLESGKKVLIWGALPGETVRIKITRHKSKLAEAIATEIITPSDDRAVPLDSDSYLSTSPWQIMNYKTEENYKKQLLNEFLDQHQVPYQKSIGFISPKSEYFYRNKMEFSWYSDYDETTGHDTLDLAFYRRGSKGKYPIDTCSLADKNIMKVAKKLRDFLHENHISARQLKSLVIRSSKDGQVIWNLYVKDQTFIKFSTNILEKLGSVGGKIIYSNPKSPASVSTKVLQTLGKERIADLVLDIPFSYSAESFFQINIPIYETVLNDIKKYIGDEPIVDLYSGVGSIGLSVANSSLKLVEINESAALEARRNIEAQNKQNSAEAILSPSEKALDYINQTATIIVDPPRAGLHRDIIERILAVKPPRIIYLSCNPATQCRDLKLLSEAYRIKQITGYNFFPKTPHIESLAILELDNN